MRATTIQQVAALAVSLRNVQAAPNDTVIAANLEHYWSYGRSPPVYPSPQLSGTGGWAESLEYARQLMSQMTNDEKNNLTYGYASTTNGCSGNIPPLERLGFPGMCFQDSGNGVRGTDGVNGGASGISIGASWNRNLALRRAQNMGREFKGKGADVVLGPVVGPLGKVAEGGRNWEGFSNDPYLAGELVYETITGIQESVIACVKHFILNEQETNRNPPLIDPTSFNVSISSNVDDKTMHELYLWPFQDAVYAGAGSVMCSYNQINGSYGCQNSKTLNGLLKEELGFQGFVVTDWGAQRSGLAAARAGLDMVMPSSTYWENGNLTLMVNNGSLPQSRLDDMLTRIIASWHRFGQVGEPGAGMPISLLAPHEFVDVRDPSANDMLLQTAVEGHVLVKNVDGALPLQKPKVLSLFGYDGVAQAVNEPPLPGSIAKWTFGLANTQTLGPYEGDFNDTYLWEVFASSEPSYVPVPDTSLNGTVITGGGSGSVTPAYIDAPYDAFLRQARIDGTYLAWDFYSPEPTVNGASDACIVFINAIASEGWDRQDLADSYSDHLIETVASQCSNTMVVIHNAGIRLVDSWIDNPNVTAVLYAHLPGQDSGQAIVDIMYGVTSPSGRLPYTVAKKPADYGVTLHPTVATNTTEWHTQDNFTEGIFIDYKHFIAKNITPRYEFGYGLTYSTFDYSDLQASTVGDLSTAPLSSNTELVEGGVPELWDVVAQVSATITNSGSVAAAEVAQLYINIPGGPAKVLRGFEKSYMQPGESCTVQFQLTRRDLSTWDVVSQNWVLQSGSHAVYVGKSVLDIQLQGSISI